jgi:hypothetical protein
MRCLLDKKVNPNGNMPVAAPQGEALRAERILSV